MKFEKSKKSDLIVPKSKVKPKPFKTFLWTCHYWDDVERFGEACTKFGASVYAIIPISTMPFQSEYAIVYRSDEEIDVEVKC